MVLMLHSKSVHREIQFEESCKLAFVRKKRIMPIYYINERSLLNSREFVSKIIALEDSRGMKKYGDTT